MTRIIFSLAALAIAASCVRAEGLDWPANRLLPAFSKPAKTIDCINLQSATGAEIDLFASLEGIVNRTQPRIACVTTKQDKDWLKIHQLHYRRISGFAAVAKYKTSVTGLVVTDTNQPATLNLATTIAGLKDELICDPSLLKLLTNAPYNFAVKDDLRGRFSSRDEVYQFLFDHYWPQCTHRVIAGLSPNTHGDLRDYLVAVKSAVMWLAPSAGGKDDAMLGQFLSGMTPAHGVYLGWWPSEADGMKWIAQYGIPVMASDFFNNASLFSGVVQPINVPAIPPTPPLENKIYATIIISDGDNVQYMQHRLKQNWSNSARGSVPIGWTVSPLAADLDPAMLNFFWSTATKNDCLVSGPSGAGYARINFWHDTNALTAFTKISDAYLKRSGLRVITVWNRVTAAVANSFATNCPSLLGITDQNGVGYTALDFGLPVAGFAANANYTSKMTNMLNDITSATNGWNGTAPRFVALQGNGWDISPADCQKIAAKLDKIKFAIVRPDHFFLLLKESLASHPAASATTVPTPANKH